jgi:hypothetical protein
MATLQLQTHKVTRATLKSQLKNTFEKPKIWMQYVIPPY